MQYLTIGRNGVVYILYEMCVVCAGRGGRKEGGEGEEEGARKERWVTISSLCPPGEMWGGDGGGEGEGRRGRGSRKRGGGRRMGGRMGGGGGGRREDEGEVDGTTEGTIIGKQQ